MPRSRATPSVLALLLAACGGGQPDQRGGAALPLGSPTDNVTPSAPVGTLAGTAEVTGAGAATYTVPIAVPPGIRGMAPSLSLSYSHQRGNGLLGVGWALEGLPSIRRCARTLADDGQPAPIRFDDDDELCLGGERLVRTARRQLQPGSRYLKRRNDGTAISMMAGDTQPNHYFRATTRDHHYLYFGGSSSSSAHHDGVVYEWMLSAIEDRHGNRIEIEHDISVGLYSGADGAVNGTIEARPEIIRYTESTSPGGAFIPGSRTVEFDYEPRPDILTDWFAGARRVVSQRLSAIRVTAPSGEVRRYQLTYDEGPASGRSRLIAIQECDGLAVCKPSTSLAWQDGAAGYVDYAPPAEQADPPVYARDLQRSAFLDLDGDGKHELLFATQPSVQEFPAFACEAPWRVWNPLADFGDQSITDLEACAFYDVAGPSAVYDDTFGVYNFSNQPDPAFVVGNFDGDRRDDVLNSGMVVSAPAEADGEPTNSDHLSFRFVGDFDGNGFADVAQCLPDGSFRVGLNARNGAAVGGHSFAYFDLPATDQLSCSNYDDYLLFDVDGDGATEILLAPAVVGPEIDLDAPRFYDIVDLQIGVAQPFATVRPSNLPYDLFQRWRDETCHNGLLHGFFPHTFGIGPGLDKVADFTGDGLADLLRFDVELLPGEDWSDAVRARFGDMAGVAEEDYVWHDFCADSEPDRTHGFRLYENTGSGFIDRGFVWVDVGDPHVALHDRFIPAQAVDSNSDGRADLVFPDLDGDWQVLVPGVSLTPLGVNWPVVGVVDPDESLLETAWGVERPIRRIRSRVLSNPDVNGDGMSDLVFIQGGPMPELWDRSFNVVTRDGARPDLITEVVDGLGHATRFDYALASDPEVVQGEGRTPHGALIVRALRVDAGAVGLPLTGPETYGTEPGWELVTEYAHHQPRLDTRGRGLIGFERVRAVSSARRSYDHDMFSPPDRWLSVNETWFGPNLDYDVALRDAPLAGHPRATVTTRQVERDGDSFLLVDVRERTYSVNDVWTASADPVIGFPPPPQDPPIFSVRTDSDSTASYELRAGECANDAPQAIDSGAPYCRVEEVAGETPLRHGSVAYTYDVNDNIETADHGNGNGQRRLVTTEYFQAPTDPWWPHNLPKRVTVQGTAPGQGQKIREVEYDYDFATGALTVMHRAPGHPTYDLVAVQEYTSQGNPWRSQLFSVDGSVRRVEHVYDADGYFISNSSAPDVGLSESFLTHDGLGVVTHVIMADGVVHEALVDGFGRRTGSRRRDGLFGLTDGADTTIDYLAGSDLGAATYRIQLSKLGAPPLTLDLDRRSRVLRRRWPGFAGPDEGNGSNHLVTEVTMFNPQGGVAHTWGPYRGDEDPDDLHHGHVYDGAGRRVWSVLPGAISTEQRFDGNSVTRTDADDRTVTEIFDQSGLLAATRDHLGTETCYDRGHFGQVVAVRRNCAPGAAGPHPPASTMSYDDYGYLERVFTPERGTLTQRWNGFGQPTQLSDAEGQTSVQHYDAIGRTDFVEFADGVTDWQWAGARLAQVTSPEGIQTHFDFDSFGRLSNQFVVVGADVMAMHFDYDVASRVWRTEYPSAAGTPFRVQQTYDAAGYVSSVTDADTGALLWRPERATALNQLEREIFGGTPAAPAVITQRTYDPSTRRLLSIDSNRPFFAFSIPVARRDYEWTDAGDLEHEIDELTDNATYFDYDELHRLRSASTVVDGGLPVVVGLEYDVLGDIESKDDVGTYRYDEATRRLQTAGWFALSYDDNGAVTARGATTMTYDPRGRVATLTHLGVTATFGYDGFGQRIRRTDDTGAERLHLPGSYERHTSAAGEIEHKYTVDGWGRPVAQIVRQETPAGLTSSTHFLQLDYRGSVIASVNGFAVARAAYDAWGAAVSPTDWTQSIAQHELGGPTIGFTGHEATVEQGGLLNLRARMYDPVMGRFMQADPIVQSLYDPRSHNAYSYVWNQPTRLTDPTGMAPEPEDAFDEEPDPGWFDDEGPMCEAGASEVEYYDDGEVAGMQVSGELTCEEPAAEEASGDNDALGGSPDDYDDEDADAEEQDLDMAAPVRDGRGMKYKEYISGRPASESSGYRYTMDHFIGTPEEGITPEKAMKLLQSRPNAFFPFWVRPVGDADGTICPGCVYDLVGARVPGVIKDSLIGRIIGINSNEVRVTTVSARSFTFTTLESHFDSAGGTITFQMIEDSKGVWLRKIANAPGAGWLTSLFAETGAWSAWAKQAEGLRRVLTNDDPYEEPIDDGYGL